MTKSTRIRLFLALFVLAVTAGVMGFASAPEALAIPCCQECQAQVSACANAPGSSPCFGDFFCCLNQSSFCFNHCTRC